MIPRDCTDAELLNALTETWAPRDWSTLLEHTSLRAILDGADSRDQPGLAVLAELARRYARAPWLPGVELAEPGQVFRHFRHLSTARTEELWLVLLDSRSRKIVDVRLSHGTLDETVWHARDVVHLIAKHNAAGFLLVHNHPSGDPLPSPSDHAETARLAKIAKLLRVAFTDHVIIGRAGFYSFSDTGEL